MKKNIIILISIIAIIAIVIFSIRFLGGDEDTWICQNGEWIKHGNPSAPKPSEPCEGGKPQYPETPDKSDLIKVNSPKPGDKISSPLVIEGEARGNWYFEASFPVKLFYGNDSEEIAGAQVLIASGVAQAQGDWMTEDFVPFKAELNFINPQKWGGTLVLEKDNPSGLPENADELRIPVEF